MVWSKPSQLALGAERCFRSRHQQQQPQIKHSSRSRLVWNTQTIRVNQRDCSVMRQCSTKTRPRRVQSRGLNGRQSMYGALVLDLVRVAVARFVERGAEYDDCRPSDERTDVRNFQLQMKLGPSQSRPSVLAASRYRRPG